MLPGDAHADLTSNDTFVSGVPHATFQRLRDTDPVSWVEEHDGTLVVSGDSGIPLVRYHIADEGGVLPYAALIARLRGLGFDAEACARRGGPRGVRPLPFVYVFGRSQFAVAAISRFWGVPLPLGMKSYTLLTWMQSISVALGGSGPKKKIVTRTAAEMPRKSHLCAC